MNNERLSKILLSPLVSEKTTRASEENRQVVFKVLPGSSKLEIRRAVEKMFEVSVTGVQVINVKGKTKRSGSSVAKRSNWKKAYVTLAEGSDIDFAGIV